MPPKRAGFEEAVEWITRRVESGEWPLDSRIPSQEELIETLGLGRAVVRQAIRTMSANGVLESARGRGTFVRARSAVDAVLRDHLRDQPVEQTLGLRRALEVEATGLAAAHCTDEHLAVLRAALAAPRQPCWTSAYRAATGRTEVSLDVFHTTVFAASANPLLGDLHHCAVAALRYADLHPEPASSRDEAHARIFAAIHDGDVTAARLAAAAHADRDSPSRE
ncbi:FadR/GntR family transcriptional regulator [Umezawaea tangerina]|uniref:DNA-binding FadR family transcriptional regulator n=1 Tax=Umezawaea tangerina TaxID=84725 RepID=A0A2T0THK4_9PSEU|nr:FCD domain-containing protein [Umezawaea tangerina]PRY45091.1 DNA-binding FadR family transcriptional regulator [Umezawaea tangerina]